MSAGTYEMNSQDRDARSQRWIIIFVLLSILAHLLAFLILMLVNHLVPAPKLKVPAEATPATTITLQAPPTAPPPKRTFMMNDPDALAKPNPQSPIESNNNARLKSMSQTARDTTSIMPDVVEKKTTPFLKNRPNAPSNKPDQVAPPPSPKVAPPEPKTPTPPQPTQAKPTPPTTKPPEKAPPKPAPPQPKKNEVDPTTGLPVLPPLDAPTLAPQSMPDSVPNPVSTSLPQEQSSSHGALGAHGDTSAAATATEFGRYKAAVYHAVGSRWYPKVNSYFQTMPVGLVHVQFTIHSDGTVETKILQGGDPSLQQLLSISVLSIQEAAPFPAFTDKLKQEIIDEQGGDGESYTDDFTFSVYGQ